MEFYVCNEMQKLRDILDKNNIPWEDVSDKGHDDFPFWMCRTHFKYKDYFWSVIHGYGSYGGISCFDDRWSGEFLEVMSDGINQGEPLGNCTADEIWTLMVGVKHGKRRGTKHSK